MTNADTNTADTLRRLQLVRATGHGGTSGWAIQLMCAGLITSQDLGDRGPFKATRRWRLTPAGEQALRDAGAAL